MNLALYKLQPIRFSHIGTEIGSPHTLVADPWSHIYGSLLMDSQGARAEKKVNYERAFKYLALAKEFYHSASLVSFPTNSTLFYYGMMNLVKVWISIEGVTLEKKVEHHGLVVKNIDKVNISTNSNPRRNTHIFAEFVKLLGCELPTVKDIFLDDVLGGIPEIHGSYSAVNRLNGQRFLPISIDFIESESSQEFKLKISYKRKFEDIIGNNDILSKFDSNGYFAEPINGDDEVVRISKKSKKITDRCYQNFLREIKFLDICSILTPKGYYYYSDLQSDSLHHLCKSYMVIFHLGSAARYRPTELDKLMKSSNRKLITESLALLPDQFLYQMTSLITEQICVLPYAKI